MTWEEVIIHFRAKPEGQEMIRLSYLEEDLVQNVQRFRASDEYKTTLKWIRANAKGTKILDLGAGNGISTISFALDGFEVTAVEPDKSLTVGSGAIRGLISAFELKNVTIVEAYAEELPFENETFDIVYARQAMHHAHDLDSFVKQSYRVLKKGGILLTVRDHVVDNESQKKDFLSYHPLHEFYGGENAFSVLEYASAIKKAGFSIKKTWGPYDSIVNLYPKTKENIYKKPLSPFYFKLLCFYYKIRTNNMGNSAGRLYSFLAKK